MFFGLSVNAPFFYTVVGIVTRCRKRVATAKLVFVTNDRSNSLVGKRKLYRSFKKVR
jgi:hypothetical protein